MSITSRRQFLRTLSVGGAAAFMPALSRTIIGDSGHRSPWSGPVPEDPHVRELANRAIDAATSAGAQYADARFTITNTRHITSFSDSEHVAVGVRALVNGAWGFVAGPAWTSDEVVRLGRQAAAQAAQNLWNPASRIELGPRPPIATGTWTTPIERDPFDVSMEEAADLVFGAANYAGQFTNTLVLCDLSCQRQERTVATSDGAFFTQVIHTAFQSSVFQVMSSDPVTQKSGQRIFEWVTPTGAGYEALYRLTNLDEMDRLIEEAQRMGNVQGADIGKFEIVFDGYAMASFVAKALGVASEIDRVRGFEANADGTSYLATAADPLTPLGTKRWSPSFLNIHGTRSMPRGAGTVKWDDEGVSPDEFDVIHNGILVDYPTTRQHVPIMRDLYTRRGQPLRSHGCSGSGTAMDFPLVMSPNLVMQPSQTTATFDDLVKSVTDGYAVIGGGWDMDHQELTGIWANESSMVYRVKRGKIVTPVAGLGLMIRSPELWKNLVALGDTTTQRTRGTSARKGQPPMAYQFSVSAPAAKVSGLAVMDLWRGLRG